MIQQIAKDNEAVTPISHEMEGLKEYFPQCFNQLIYYGKEGCDYDY